MRRPELGKGVRGFGEVPGVAPGRTFRDRAELSESGVHRPPRSGICGSGVLGAESIVISGGYEDDRDWWDLILYTGEGGRDPKTGRQAADQPMTRGNLALARSWNEGRPVRVVRGAGLASPGAPAEGYRYDGLYRVEGCWHERGASGFLVWRFLLRRDRPESETGPAPRRESTIQRIVRSTATAQLVKAIYDHRCQVCGLGLATAMGPYAEAAHIRPIGSPHDGPDVEENLLCLCPNHHVLFDMGGFTVGDDLALVGLGGRLLMSPGHSLDLAHLAYRRERWGPADQR